MRPILITTFLFLNIHVFAQTGIGTTTPNASAKLDVYSTNKGFLPPRVTLASATDGTTIASPAEGLLVYNLGSVGLQAGYYYWNGANWATIATASSAGNGVTASELVKLYQETYSTTAGKASSSTGYSFTVPVSGRYEFNFNCTGWNSNGSSVKLTFNIREGSTVLGTDYHQSTSSNAWVEYEGRIEVNLTAGVNYNAQVVTTTGSRIAGSDWDKIMYKMVAGNLPVTGQTVDYGFASYTGADGSSLSANAIVAFDATAAGNLAWSGNKFTLKANKTYELESYLSVYHPSAGVAGVFQIYNYTNSTVLASGLYISINGAGGYNVNGNGPMRCIITPSTDITVGVRISTAYGGWPSIVGSTSTIGANGAPNQSYLLVKQIGSSAIINPWTLSGTNTYNTTGNVGIGNNSPTSTLDVTGDTKVSGVLTAGGNTYPTTTGTNGYALTTNAAGAASWNAVPPVGVITAFAGSAAPTGYLICNGAAVSRTTYAALYAIIGTTYGTGDGSTTFNIPDLTGRVPVGKNAGTFSTLGAKGGEETHTMTVNEMPAHKHTTTVNSASEVASINGYAASTQSMYFGTDRASTTNNYSSAMQNTGGGVAFNQLQPYTVLNYIIKF